jgi:hypothetical protein
MYRYVVVDVFTDTPWRETPPQRDEAALAAFKQKIAEEL